MVTPRPAVLFLDDEPFYAKVYAASLARRFVLHKFVAPDEALKALRSDKTFDAMVLDIMMPAPESVPSYRVSDGLTTGFWFLREASDVIVQRRMAIVILTALQPNLLIGHMQRLSIPAGLVDLRRKIATPAVKLPGIVERMIARAASGGSAPPPSQ